VKIISPLFESYFEMIFGFLRGSIAGYVTEKKGEKGSGRAEKNGG
jgi:hypothetical protein